MEAKRSVLVGVLSGVAVLVTAQSARANAQVAPGGESLSQQGAEPPSEAMQAATARRASSFPALPAMFETGRVARAYPEGQAPIGRQEATAVAAENVVQRYAAGPQADRRGSVDRDLLDAEVASRFASLRDCRYEAARAKQVPPSELEIPALQLRWTIDMAGTTSDGEVVPEATADPQVTACVKRVMGTWRFTGPAGGPVRVQYRATP